jgi:protein RecA
MTKKATKIGRLSLSEMRNLINKKVGMNVAHDLTKDNPTAVKQWIPTGSRYLDSIICRGKKAGIPVGKITEIAGLEGAGKSWMAAQVATSAQKMGIDVVYFDSESAIDPGYLENLGVDLDHCLYVQATSVEMVLETIEELLGSNEGQMLFIWDSLALTPAISDVEGDFNPQSSMAVKARILAKGMSKLTVPIANTQSTFLVLNQLKTNIASNPAQRIEVMTNPWVTPGGKAMHYAYSLRIWLTGRKSKSSFIMDGDDRIGYQVQVKVEKSRFGTTGRKCHFNILFTGQKPGIQDEESWLHALMGSDNIVQSGAWYTLMYKDGTSEKFQSKTWPKKLQNDKFRQRVLELMDDEIVKKYDRKMEKVDSKGE